MKRRKVGAKGLPWLTSDLIYKKRQVNFLNRKAKTINTTEAWTTYKKVKNHYNRQIKNTKHLYYQDKLNNNSGNLKPTNNRKPTNNKISEMKGENGEIIDEMQIPDAFNKYFVELGEKLASKIPRSSISPHSFLTDLYYPDTGLFNFQEIPENHVLNLLCGLDSKKATGIDGISSRILKLSANVIAPSLSLIFNQIISTGIFPNDWKIARITPIFKSDAKDKMTNYRPISVISIISKIAEKSIYDQIYYIN